jgi:hypothetical protein
VVGPSPTISDRVLTTHGCAQAWRYSSTSPSPPTSVSRLEIEPFRHPRFLNRD